MKVKLVLLQVLVICLTSVGQITPLGEAMNFKRPVNFIENKGQFIDHTGRPDGIFFKAQGKDIDIFVTDKGLTFRFHRLHIIEEEKKVEDYMLEMYLTGMNPRPQIVAERRTGFVTNYYFEHCPNGIFGAEEYEKITLKNIYPNIDWVLYSNGESERSIEYDFIVHPGGDPSKINIRYEGALNIINNADGSHILVTPLGELLEKAPFSYQNNAPVASKFSMENNLVCFALGNYERTKDLIIDPTLIWSTYYGGTGTENNFNTEIDALGNVYLSGETGSSSNIASGGHQNTHGGGARDLFLVKFNSIGTRMWATYYGGSGDEGAFGFSASSSGDVYVNGFTSSTSGIASGGFQNTIGGGNDAFLVKFNPSGIRQWATYYGGAGNEMGSSSTVDSNGDVYLHGDTQSSTGIASGGHQNTYSGGQDAFLVKFNSAGARLWATYYGGSGPEWSYGVATDNSNHVYLTGKTQSTANIASGGFQTSFGGAQDAYVVKFNSSGVRQWASYYGGAGNEDFKAVACAASGNVYVLGLTDANGLASGGFQSSLGGGNDLIIVKFSNSGSRIWATYYGGSGNEFSSEICLDTSENMFFAGVTTSTNNISTANGHQLTHAGGTDDGFFAKLDPNCNRIFGSYAGSSGADVLIGSKISGNHLFVSGYSTSTSGIATGGFQNTNGGGYDATLYKFFVGVPVSSFTVSSTAICIGSCISFTDLSSNNPTAWSWKFPGATITTSTLQNPTNICYDTAGTYAVILKVTNSNGADSLTQTAYITVNPLPSVAISGSGTICAGDNTTLAASGANTYTWSTTATTSSISVSPTSNVTYSITGTDANGCQNTASHALTVNPLPLVSIAGTNTICAGDSTTLAASGANTYTWNTTAAAASITVSPSSNTTYTVTGTDANGCQNTASHSLTVNPLPSVSIAGTNAICTGDNTILAASGANTYTWNTTATTSSISVSPTSNTTYTVTGTDANGCQNTATHALTVNPLPSVSIAGTNTICAGDSTILGASGANTYTWSTTATAASITVSPTSNTTYTVTGTDVNGCSDTAAATVTANAVPATPTITASVTVLSSSAVSGNQWYLGGSPIAGATGQTYTMTANGNYMVCVSNSAGCQSCSQTYTMTSIGIQEASVQATGLIIYPNPSNGEFTIKSNNEDRISVINELGQCVKTIELESSNDYTTTLNGLAGGVYFIVGKAARYKVIVLE